MQHIKEKVHEIKVRYAKKDRKMATLFPIMLVIAYLATYFNLGIAIFIGIMAFVISITFLIKNHFSEIEERMELLENELKK